MPTSFATDIRPLQRVRLAPLTLRKTLGNIAGQTRRANTVAVGTMPLYNANTHKEGIPMSAENKTLVRRWFKDIWSKGNLAVADEIVAPNYANHDPAGPMPESGLAGLKKHVITYRTAFPDLML